MKQPLVATSRRLATLAIAAAAALLSACSSTPTAAPQKATGRYAFWPPPPSEPRIQFVTGYALAGDVKDGSRNNWERVLLGEKNERDTAIQKPYGVAAMNGKIYVCDIRAGGVVILDLAKSQARLIGMTGSQRMVLPVDVAVASDGEIFVADKSRGGVMVYGADERFRRSFDRPDFQPVGVAVFGDRLYVSNMTTQTVEVLDRRTGSLIQTIGTVGDDDGQFRLPLGVEVDPDGNLYVVDMMRCRMQVFNPEGQLINAVGQLGDTSGNFVRPKHVALDDDGISYVIDAAFNNVQMFDAAQQLLMHFGGPGSHPGAMDLPAGVAVMEGGAEHFANRIHPGFDARRLIIVTNQFGPHKVAVYAFGQRREGWSIESIHQSAQSLDPDEETEGPLLPGAAPLEDEDPSPHGDAPPPHSH
jgi:sugar lactone lactonase YvrE